MYKWEFSCRDNSGKYQHFIIKASSKDEAIKKGMEKAKKGARGDICPNWNCNLCKC